jgi:glycosyltransferase involved in cell wall biosynthesis
VIITARGSDLKVFNEKKIFKPIIHQTLKKASKVICVSHDLKNITMQTTADEKNVVFIPPGINLGEFKPHNKHEIRKKLHIDQKSFIAIYVGNLKKIKNVNTLINIIRQISEKHQIRLIIIGDGPEKRKLLRKVETLGMHNVYFYGSINHAEMPYYLSASDLMILPSKSEGLPMCIQEAMACGTPVIANDVGGVSWLLQNGKNGVLTKDENEIHSALESFLSDPSLLNKYRNNSLSFARRHLSHITVSSQIEEVLTQT